MSQLYSSSDSEDDSPGLGKPQQKSEEPSQRVWKYESPADFVSFKSSSSVSSLLDSSDHTELWLIKAPARFNPQSLADLKVPLSGLEKLQSTNLRTPQFYSVLGSGAGPTDLHLLTSSCKNKDVSLSASVFTGVLNISETFGDCSKSQCPIAIPAAPAPSIPTGLRQRFQPFGSSVMPQAADVASISPVPFKREKLDMEESEEHRKKNKKKKKEKRRRQEETEEMHIKQEDVSNDFGEIQTSEPVEEEEIVARSKKKKMKKEKERRERLDEVAVDAKLITKQEPIDTSYGDLASPVKKKKKKKTRDV